MASTKTPSGMRDFLPEEKKIREYLKSVIREEYRKSGFKEIETSQIENLENLTQSDGGENTKLIFKILKRGEKLKMDEARSEDDLADLGLRFDLTLPLSRFYSNNKNELPQIFKAFQMGYVFRAERAQKGRYRAFMQCDIDTIGEASNLAEIELLSCIYRTLSRLGLKGLTFKINDRRLLKKIVLQAGFSEEEFSDVAISLDKIDKIGEEGIYAELSKKKYSDEAIASLIRLNAEIKAKGLEYAKQIDQEAFENISKIIDVLESLHEDIRLEFDHSLVRGMGYYTGTIFEVFYEGSNFALGGGGRYDKMIEKLCGIDLPACGFSIGYERLVDIIKEEKISLPDSKSLAFFFSEEDDIKAVMKEAQAFRNEYDEVSVLQKKKKFGKQVSRLKEDGFSHFYDTQSKEVKELE